MAIITFLGSKRALLEYKIKANGKSKPSLILRCPDNAVKLFIWKSVNAYLTGRRISINLQSSGGLFHVSFGFEHINATAGV